jgi:hypothetical protein
VDAVIGGVVLKLRKLSGALVALALVSALLVSSADAKKDPSLEILHEMGFTDEQLAHLTPDFKDHLVKDMAGKISIVSVKSETVPIGGGETSTTPGEVSPSTIPDSQMQLTTTVAAYLTPGASTESFYIASNFKWLQNPFFHWTDRLGIAWSGPLVPYADTLKAVWRGENTAGTCTSSWSDQVPEDNGANGFGFEIRWGALYGCSDGSAFTKLSGYIEGSIGKSVNTSEEHLGFVVSKYYHQQLCTGDSSLTFSPGPSIGIGIGTCYDASSMPGANFTYHGS